MQASAAEREHLLPRLGSARRKSQAGATSSQHRARLSAAAALGISNDHLSLQASICTNASHALRGAHALPSSQAAKHPADERGTDFDDQQATTPGPPCQSATEALTEPVRRAAGFHAPDLVEEPLPFASPPTAPPGELLSPRSKAKMRRPPSVAQSTNKFSPLPTAVPTRLATIPIEAPTTHP